MRDVLSADHYTHQKYSKLRKRQINSRIDRRGLFKEKAKVFPNNLRAEFVNKRTPQQLRQQQIKQQKFNQQRKQRNNLTVRGKMSQQRAAAQHPRVRAQSNKIRRNIATQKNIQDKKSRTQALVDDFLSGIE